MEQGMSDHGSVRGCRSFEFDMRIQVIQNVSKGWVLMCLIVWSRMSIYPHSTTYGHGQLFFFWGGVIFIQTRRCSFAFMRSVGGLQTIQVQQTKLYARLAYQTVGFQYCRDLFCCGLGSWCILNPALCTHALVKLDWDQWITQAR